MNSNTLLLLIHWNYYFIFDQRSNFLDEMHFITIDGCFRKTKKARFELQSIQSLMWEKYRNYSNRAAATKLILERRGIPSQQFYVTITYIYVIWRLVWKHGNMEISMETLFLLTYVLLTYYLRRYTVM